MGLMSGNSDKIELSKKLTKDESETVCKLLQANAFTIQDLQAVNDLRSGKRTWISRAERSRILNNIDPMVKKLEIVRFYRDNEQLLQNLLSIKDKL